MLKINKNGTVAHYTRLDCLGKILRKKTLKLSPVSKFNDPRESSLSWLSTVGIGDGPDLEQCNQAREIKKSAGLKINILCTCGKIEDSPASCPIESATYGRPRMWSQYGDNSKGFCIVLNQERLNYELQKISIKPEYLITDKVQYYKGLHFVGGGSTLEYSKNVDLSKKDLFEIINDNNMLHSIYFKKSIDWKDECEYRWLLFSNECKTILVSIEKCIEGVVLGCNFPTDKFDEVREYCNQLKCPCYILSYEHPQYRINEI